MEEILHGHHTSQVRKQGHNVIGTCICRGISQGRKRFCKIVERIKSSNTATCSGFGRRLRDGVDTYLLQFAITVPIASGDTFQQGLGICHIRVERKYPLCCDVGKPYYRSPFFHDIHFFGYLHHFMERDRRHIVGLHGPIVIEIAVGFALTDVWRHADGV